MTSRFCRNVIQITYIFLILLIIQTKTSFGGWSPKTHRNYLKEAIRILPYFDYLWCNYYKSYLMEGIIEGEFHFRFFANNRCPNWQHNNINERDYKFINGYNIRKEDIFKAVEFFNIKFENLKRQFKNADRRNSEIMFELGYYLHSINNTLLLHEKLKNMPSEERFAQNTDSLELRSEYITDIKDLKSWLVNILTENIKMREYWGKISDRNHFKKYSNKVNIRNIYNIASIIHYVMAESFGPKNQEARKSISSRMNQRYKGGRKPDIE